MSSKAEVSRRWPGWSAALLLSIVVALAGCGDDDGGGGVDPASVLTGERFVNIAHRGGGRLAPEHTLVAYENALRVGADVIEFDVHATSDGVVVVLHDATVDRTTDGTGTVRDMTLAQIKALDAGYRWTRDGGATYPWRGRGLTIPTLEEALVAFPNVPLAIEIKQVVPEIADRVVDLLERYDAIDRTVLASFDRRPVGRVRELQPQMLTAFTSQELVTLGVAEPGMTPPYAPPALVVQPPRAMVTPEFVAKVHAFGLKLHPWTINDEATMRQLIADGVDGMYTDDPELLHRVLGR